MIIFLISVGPLADWISPENVYLSSANVLCGSSASESQALGHCGDSSCGQPGLPSAGYGSSFWGPWWWQCGSEKSAHMPLPKGPVPWYCPPLTTPLSCMYCQGLVMSPPSQPSSDAQKHTSCADKGKLREPLLAMHIRSDAASAAPNAQQQPQLDWSRISVMTFAHCGHCSAESKWSGISASVSPGDENGFTAPLFSAALSTSFQFSFTPHHDFTEPGASDANLGFSAGCHSTPGVCLMSSICFSRSGCATVAAATAAVAANGGIGSEAAPARGNYSPAACAREDKLRKREVS
mmetsp:Transcript_22580/g.64153  ORF Transcript_22580/g.64153 Transcript_22580/m.64153 type:complete len:293 (-) Transcript_22580:3-881(-)